jgi:hypothetical protein
MSRRKKAVPVPAETSAPHNCPSPPRTKEEKVYDAAWSTIRVVKTLHLWREGSTGLACTCLICQKARALREALLAAGITEPVVPKITPALVEEEAGLRTRVELTEEVLAQLREND